MEGLNVHNQLRSYNFCIQKQKKKLFVNPPIEKKKTSFHNVTIKDKRSNGPYLRNSKI